MTDPYRAPREDKTKLAVAEREIVVDGSTSERRTAFARMIAFVGAATVAAIIIVHDAAWAAVVIGASVVVSVWWASRIGARGRVVFSIEQDALVMRRARTSELSIPLHVLDDVEGLETREIPEVGPTRIRSRGSRSTNTSRPPSTSHASSSCGARNHRCASAKIGSRHRSERVVPQAQTLLAIARMDSAERAPQSEIAFSARARSRRGRRHRFASLRFEHPQIHFHLRVLGLGLENFSPVILRAVELAERKKRHAERDARRNVRRARRERGFVMFARTPELFELAQQVAELRAQIRELRTQDDRLLELRDRFARQTEIGIRLRDVGVHVRELAAREWIEPLVFHRIPACRECACRPRARLRIFRDRCT